MSVDAGPSLVAVQARRQVAEVPQAQEGRDRSDGDDQEVTRVAAPDGEVVELTSRAVFSFLPLFNPGRRGHNAASFGEITRSGDWREILRFTCLPLGHAAAILNSQPDDTPTNSLAAREFRDRTGRRAHRAELTTSAVLRGSPRPIVVLAFGTRIYNLNWDEDTHLHPDERGLTMVATNVKLPSSISEYLVRRVRP